MLEGFGTLLHHWWECKLVYPLWKTVWRFLIKLKIELPYDPAIPLLDIYLDKTTIQKDIGTPMGKAALVTKAKMWKQPKCPPTEEQMKMWCIYTIKYYSVIEKSETVTSASGLMQLEIITLSAAICIRTDATRDYHTKCSKSEEKGKSIWYHLYVELKTWHK